MPPPTQPKNHQQPDEPAADAATVLALQLEPLRPLLDQLADLIADRVAHRLAVQPLPESELQSRRFLTLDELVALLPPGKKAATWKAWLYQRTRIPGAVPGQHKFGGRLFFDPELTLPWLLNRATGGPRKTALDVPAQPSLHDPSMAHEPAQARQPAQES
jgi:hypothetical protein